MADNTGKQSVLIYQLSTEPLDRYQQYLTSQGFEIFSSSDKKMIIEIMNRQDPAAVITFYQREQQAAIDFLRYIMRQHPYTQRIFITDHLEKELIQKVINKAHINYLLFLPFEMKELKETVGKALKRYWSLTQPYRRFNELADITAELLEDVNNLRNEAGTDVLTNLLNRRSFEKILEKALQLFFEKNLAFSMVLIDLDDFKKLNDTYGHPAGDEVLRVFGRVLLANMRQEDHAFRYGGEEFAVIASGDVSENIKHFINRIRLEVKNMQVLFENQPLKVTFSAGLVAMRDTFGKDELITAADKALYQAKKSGKDRVIDYDELRDI